MSKLANTPNGSWGMVQIRPTSNDLDHSRAPRMNLNNQHATEFAARWLSNPLRV